MATAQKNKAAPKVATNVAVGGTSVTIGCKLPHGIVLDHPLDTSKKVELKGKNSSLIIGAEYGTTVILPDAAPQPEQRQVVNLWD